MEEQGNSETRREEEASGASEVSEVEYKRCRGNEKMEKDEYKSERRKMRRNWKRRMGSKSAVHVPIAV